MKGHSLDPYPNNWKDRNQLRNWNFINTSKPLPVPRLSPKSLSAKPASKCFLWIFPLDSMGIFTLFR